MKKRNPLILILYYAPNYTFKISTYMFFIKYYNKKKTSYIYRTKINQFF